MNGRIFVLFADGDAVSQVAGAVDKLIARIDGVPSVPNGKSLIVGPAVPEAVPDTYPIEETLDVSAEEEDEFSAVADRASPTDDTGGGGFVKVLRAVADSDGKAGTIGKEVELGTNNQLLKKLRAEGLLKMTGEKSAARWSVTEAGLKKMHDAVSGNGAASGNRDGGDWSAESRRVYAFLTNLDRPCRITDVLDELGMSRYLFNRAVCREEFTVKGEFVELTP